MKKFPLALPFLLAVVPALAQNQVRPRIASAVPRTEENQTTPSRGRTSTVTPVSVELVTGTEPKPEWGDSAIRPRAAAPMVAQRPAPLATNVHEDTQIPPRLVKPTSLSVYNAAGPDMRSAHATAPTLIYRVGVGDVLDIRLTNIATRDSTLFTVLKDGQLEYPLLAAPISVAGLTPDEIARHLASEIRVLQNPRVSVDVRDYTSHNVLVSGAVDNPGRKILRREAMPLFALLAEASPRADATTVVLNRNGKETTLSLANNNGMSALVMAGDIVKITSPAKEFIYLGGDIASPGEKEFHSGMTLAQALLAAGARTTKVTIAKRNAEGLLNTRVYDLQLINQGKAADPILEAGDRIEVKRSL